MADRPRVLMNFASSVDGKIALAPHLRKRPFTMSRGKTDHERMRELRSMADAILIGAGNLRVDNPDLALSDEERESRRARGERQPYRAVVTRRGDGVTPDRKIFDASLGGPSFVVHTEEMPGAVRERLAVVATLVAFGDTNIDVARMLDWMSRELGVRTLLCEGGGIVASELFRVRAVDELYVTLVPRVLGGADAPTLVEGAGFLPDEVPDASLGAVDRVGDELYLRYDFHWS